MVLFADGHVQSIEHQWLTANQSIWNWQNTTPSQFLNVRVDASGHTYA